MTGQQPSEGTYPFDPPFDPDHLLDRLQSIQLEAEHAEKVAMRRGASRWAFAYAQDVRYLLDYQRWLLRHIMALQITSAAPSPETPG